MFELNHRLQIKRETLQESVIYYVDNFASGIFLNRDEECSGGTSFFKNDQYLGYVKMKFNRMILYFQNVQHTARMEMNSFVGGNYRISQQFFI